MTATTTDLTERLDDSRSLYQSAEQKFANLEQQHHQILVAMTSALADANNKIVSLQNNSSIHAEATNVWYTSASQALTRQISEREQDILRLQQQLVTKEQEINLANQERNELDSKINVLMMTLTDLQSEMVACRNQHDSEMRKSSLQMLKLQHENHRLSTSPPIKMMSPVKDNNIDHLTAVVETKQARIDDLETRLAASTEVVLCSVFCLRGRCVLRRTMKKNFVSFVWFLYLFVIIGKQAITRST